MRLKKQILNVTIFIFSISVVAKNPISNLKDTLIIKDYIKQSFDSLTSNPTYVLILGKTINDASLQLNYKKGIAEGLNILGLAYSNLGKETSALFYFEQANNYAAKHKLRRSQASIQNNIGNLYYSLGQSDKAFNAYSNSLEIKKVLFDTMGIANAYRNIGNVLAKREYFDQSTTYFKQALFFFHYIKDTISESETYNNIGQNYVQQKKYKMALHYLFKSVELNKMAGVGEEYNQYAYINLADCYISTNNLDLGKYYCEKSLELLKIMPDKENEMLALMFSGYIAYKQGNLNDAETFYIQSKVIAEETDELVDLCAINKGLSKVYKDKGNHALALKLLNEANQIQDSIYTQDKLKAINDLVNNYEKKEEVEKNKLLSKENDIAKLKIQQQTIFMYGGLLAVLFLSIVAYLVYKQKQLKNERVNAILQQKLLLLQMNPHFIFNSIDSIQGLIYNKREEEAINYLTKFSELTRQILEQSRESYIPLHDELITITNYLSIQQLLYSHSFTYDLTVDESIDTDAILIPPMLTQPFIENAIKHGFANQRENGKIQINFLLEHKKLIFEIYDNGFGINDNSHSKSHKSLATTITKERLKGLFSKNNKASESIQLVNVYDENNIICGAKLSFQIPYIYEN